MDGGASCQAVLEATAIGPACVDFESLGWMSIAEVSFGSSVLLFLLFVFGRTRLRSIVQPTLGEDG